MQWSFTPSCIYIPPSLSPLPCTQRHCRLHIYERPSLCTNATQNHYHAGLALRPLLPQTHAWIRQIFISPPLSFAGGGVSKRVRPLPPASFTTASQLAAGRCCKPQSREQSQNPGPSPLPPPPLADKCEGEGRGGGIVPEESAPVTRSRSPLLLFSYLSGELVCPTHSTACLCVLLVCCRATRNTR